MNIKCLAKLITISDIEGNFDGFSSFLQANKIIDDHFNWIFGDGHLVLLGDFVDRGESVIPTLWLIYKLETEAEKSGGKVHFILGNHEIMNIQGNFKYAKDKYKKIATNKSEDLTNQKKITKYCFLKIHFSVDRIQQIISLKKLENTYLFMQDFHLKYFP